MKRIIVILSALIFVLCFSGCSSEPSIKTPSNAAVGDVVKYGNYRGTEIEWIVLDKKEGKIYAISKDILEVKEFDDYTNLWENSFVKAWLEFIFQEEAFSSDEFGKLVKHPETDELVTLLSLEEAYKYMPEAKERIAFGTNYAKGQGLTTHEGGASYWFLRTPYLNNDNCDLCVGPDGEIGGNKLGYKHGVRPCIWIKTN